jgi:hypothetical protein
MAKHTKQNTPIPDVLDQSSGLGELEKVRTILFGEQIRAFETRMRAIEATFTERLDVLRQDVRTQFAALAAEQGAIAQRLAEVERGLAQRVEAVAQEHQAALQARAEDLHQALSARIDELGERQRSTHVRLDADKIDRTQLAAFLTHFAEQLTAGRQNDAG